jgi:hypothetical protein
VLGLLHRNRDEFDREPADNTAKKPLLRAMMNGVLELLLLE